MPLTSILDPRQRQQPEAAGDEIKTEQHDEDEADREDERADQRLAGLHHAGECQTRGRGKNGAGEAAADNEVERRQRQLGAAGIHHGGGDVRRLDVIHVWLP